MRDLSSIFRTAGPTLVAAGLFVGLALWPLPAAAQAPVWKPPQLPAPAKVEIVSAKATKGAFTADVYRPADQKGPTPVVVALHGCGGLMSEQGRLRHREMDWTARWLAAGYTVVLPDSFNPRGYRQICTAKTRQIMPQDRAGDVAAVFDWIATRSDLDGARVALVGWSHGAMSTLWAVRPGVVAGQVKPKVALAFYPGCREIAKLPDWRPAVPLIVLSGANDDWTNPAPCRELSRRTGFTMIEYPGAYHDFDAPDTPLRTRTGISSLKSGTAHIGTDPQARAAAIGEVTRRLTQAFAR